MQRERDNRSRPEPRLTARQYDLVRDIKTFGIIRESDLASARYEKDREALRTDLSEVASARRMTYVDLRSRTVEQVVMLRGRQLGRDVRHELAVYPATLDEISRINLRGGEVDRVLTERQLRAERNHITHELYPRSRRLTPEQQERVAERMSMRVVYRDGKTVIPLPDSRIEYRDRYGRKQIRDVEIRSQRYASKAAASKAAAGFSMHGGTHHGSPVWDDRGIWGESGRLE